MKPHLLVCKTEHALWESYHAHWFVALFVVCFAWFQSAASLKAAGEFPTESLHVVADIDGTDDLHLSRNGARWVHKSWSHPTDVKLNGESWNPQKNPNWKPANGEPLFPPDLDLSGVVMHFLRGRGSAKLSRDGEDLVISFDDWDNGDDVYEVSIDFAQIIARDKPATPPPGDLDLHLRSTVNGMEEMWLSGHEATWIHNGWQEPVATTINGKLWNVTSNRVFDLGVSLSPEIMDLQRASLKKLHGRGTVALDYRPERVCLILEDYEGGSDVYEAAIRIPVWKPRHLVRVMGENSGAMLGAALKIIRFPDALEARAALAGQRLFNARGECLAALEPGEYQFEVLHQAGSGRLIALKTGRMMINGETNIDLNAFRVEPQLFWPDGQKTELNEFALRSARPTGQVVWKYPEGGLAPTLIISRGQTYKFHAFGHVGTNWMALWQTADATNFATIKVETNMLLCHSFEWAAGTPQAEQKGVRFQFPDGEFKIPRADKIHFFTNRRFFDTSYWLSFSGNRKAVFQPIGRLFNAPTKIEFGGPLRAVVAAAVMTDENLGKADARRLWWEITLVDGQNYLLDTSASTIGWKPVIRMKDGKETPAAPLTDEAVKTLGNLKDTLIASAAYSLDVPLHAASAPQLFVPFQQRRFATEVLPYHVWNTATYLAKAERELNLIFFVRQMPNDPKRHINIKWWLNHGAVGGGDTVTMPFDSYLGCQDWFTHPWAIAHEMLHTFGVGHTYEMTRLDNEIQERMERFRYQAADNPDFRPEGM